MSFFDELKRRNVIRVAIAYGVAAWFILQLSDVVLENISAPDWVMQTIMLVLAIGLPVVIIFAWAFEMTPEGIRKEKDVDRSQSITSMTGRKLDRMIIGILTVTVAYLLIDKLVLVDTEAPAETTQAVVTEVEPLEVTNASVAVLPFVNMSGDKENEYFSDGLTETLLHMLAQLPELRVAARTSSFAFKGQNSSVGEIATTLGVAHILEGSVQKSGERVRITAQLIRANDGFHVWSQNYTRPLEDIFAIQDEIATDVATALNASLLGISSPSDNTVPGLKGLNTTDLNAYDNYLKGLEQQATFSYGSLNIAEDNFRQALARDPGFTDARLALVRNYVLKFGTGAVNKHEVREFVTPLIAQVREKDPENRLARAFELQIDLWDFDPGQDIEQIRTNVTDLRNMLPLIADETMIRTTVASFLNDLFKQERDAIEVLEAGLMLDPLSDALHAAMGDLHEDHDRLEDALVSYTRAQELAPQNPNHYGDLSGLELRNNNLTAALEWVRLAFEVDPQDHELASVIAETFYRLKLPEEGDQWLNRVNALVPGSDIARKLEVERALSRGESERAIELSRAMLIDQVSVRRGSFFVALDAFSSQMMLAGKSEQAFEQLVSINPEITQYDKLPQDTQGLMMQFESVMLMSGFESFEAREERWLKMTVNFDAMGFPWRDPESGNLVIDRIITGDIEGAIENVLNHQLSKPLASELDILKTYQQPFFKPVSDDPRVAARLAELNLELEQFREEVGDMLLKPEWNQ